MIKKFNEFISEAHILPTDSFMNDVEIKLKDAKNHDDPTAIIDTIENLEVVELEDFLKTIKDDDERKMMRHASIIPGISLRFLGINPEENIIKFVVGSKEGFNKLYKNLPEKDFLNIANQIKGYIGHENIHNQQINKMKVKSDPILNSPEKYYKNPQEIMAMAYTTAKELLDHFEKDSLISKIKTNNLNHPLLSTYKRLGGVAYKKFIKYLINYIESL